MASSNQGRSLRQRAEAATTPGTDLDRTPQGETLRQQIERMRDEFDKAAPRGIEAQQIVRDALTCLRTVDKLAEAEPRSVLGALMTGTQLGLRPGVLGHYWPLPFWNGEKKQFVAQFVIGYQGLVELMHRVPKVASVVGREVRERDEFDIEYGLADVLVHKPYRGPEGRGEPTDFYSVVKFTNGGHTFYHMSLGEVLQYRDLYVKNSRSPMWKGFPENPVAGLKTTLRQLARWMPKNTDLATALDVDESVRVDITPTADPAHESFHIEGEVVPPATPSGGIPQPGPVVGADGMPAGYDPTLDPGFGEQRG